MLAIITGLFFVLSEPDAGLCAANSVDAAVALAANVLPLVAVAPACNIIDFDVLSGRNPATVRWVDSRLRASVLDSHLATDRIWLTEGQARTWLSAARANVVVIVGSGVDDQRLASHCGQMFQAANAMVLRGGMTRLKTDIPTLTANEALSAMMHATPNTLTLSSSDRMPLELTKRLRALGVRVATIRQLQSAAVLALRQSHSSQTLSFNIFGGIDALLAADQQAAALAGASKSAPKRPCYFP